MAKAETIFTPRHAYGSEMLLLFNKFKFPWKNGFYKKIKAPLPQHPSALQQLFSPHLFNFIQKIFRPTPI